MKIFQKKNELDIHGKKIANLAEDLFYALKLYSGRGVFEAISGAIGEHEDLIFTEVRSADNIAMLTLDKKKKIIKGFRMNAATRYADGSFSEDNFEDRVAAILALLHLSGDIIQSEVNEFANFENSNPGTLNSDREIDLGSLLMEIESKLIKEIYTKDSIASTIQKPIQEINLSQVEMGLLMPSKVVIGDFEAFKSTKAGHRKKIEYSEIAEKFILNPERVFSEEEKALMFTVPNYYSVSSNVISIAEKVKASWDGDPNMRKVNILMEGPAGTGKTMDSKVLSSLLGLPYTKITCFSDMDSSDVTGAILPVAEDEPEISVPTDDEIFFDPAGSYERVTGKKLTDEEAMNITEDDVHEAINEAYERYYATQEGKNSPRYVYFASEIVKAFENGWVVEIQEPTCVADAAVLLVLNSALEKEGIINLAQRTVKRHPECIIIMTTNRDYEGCRPLNQALRDRFNITKKVNLPSIEEQAERLSSATGCKNMPFLTTVAESVQRLNEYLHNNGINANVSLRGMQDFVADVERGFDLRESAMEDMIYKISTDDEEVAEMENFLDLSTSLFSASYR